MSKLYRRSLLLLALLALTSLESGVSAATVQVNASSLIPNSALYFRPSTGSFEENSIIEIPILVNTRNFNVNGIEVYVNFDRNKLEIIKPSSGQSIIGVWVEPPKFDNSKGTASYVGVVPDGITTEAGLVGTISFRAKGTGRAVVTFGSNSKILLNNGLGTETVVEFGRGEYNILPKAPEGVKIYSLTHTFPSQWYNNNSPSISWDKDAGVNGFSYVLDNKPSTIPDNNIITEETTKSYENLNDGLWYFHIKAIKNGAWSATGHFPIRVDTKPPAEFTPEVAYISTPNKTADRTLISFITTDNLSGVNRYEVGVIDKADSGNSSPLFVGAESPYQVPTSGSGHLNVIIRAIDNAGNVKDVNFDVESQSLLSSVIKNNLLYILILVVLVLLTGFITNYFVGHHILRHLKRAAEYIKKEDNLEKAFQNPEVKIEDQTPKT